MEDALRVASSPHDFKLLVAAEGRTSTSMDDLADAAGEPSRPARIASSMRIRPACRCASRCWSNVCMP